MITWWYMAARAAPTKGPTQKIHCKMKQCQGMDGLSTRKHVGVLSYPNCLYKLVVAPYGLMLASFKSVSVWLSHVLQESVWLVVVGYIRHLISSDFPELKNYQLNMPHRKCRIHVSYLRSEAVWLLVFQCFTHMVIPGMFPVVDDGSPKAPSWVDAGASDGDGGQMDQEHREPNR